METDEKQQVNLYLRCEGGGFYRRVFFFTREAFAKLEADFIDYHRDGIKGAFAYDCESVVEGSSDRFATRLVVNIDRIVFIG